MSNTPESTPRTEISGSLIPILQEASRLALQMQRDCTVTQKNDGSPVTEADHAVEELLFNRINKLYPDDGFTGEEAKAVESKNDRNWIVDPIDGTVQFTRNQEFWSILVALDVATEGEVGAIAFPARQEIIYAEKGQGCWEITPNETRKLQVSTIKDLDEAYILHNGIEFARQAHRAQRLAKLLRRTYAERGYADAFGHVEIARGNADIMVDFLTEYHDIAAVRVAISEAGGSWSALDGGQLLHEDTPGSITSNGWLHHESVEHLRQPDNN